MSAEGYELNVSDNLSIISCNVGLIVFMSFIGAGFKIHSHAHDIRLHFPYHFSIHFLACISLLYFTLISISVKFDEAEKIMPIIIYFVMFLSNIWLDYIAYSFYKYN
eukprot:459472_1